MSKYTSLALLIGSIAVQGCKTANEPQRPEPYFKRDAELEKLKDGGLYERIMYMYLFGSDNNQETGKRYLPARQ